MRSRLAAARDTSTASTTKPTPAARVIGGDGILGTVHIMPCPPNEEYHECEGLCHEHDVEDEAYVMDEGVIHYMIMVEDGLDEYDHGAVEYAAEV